MNLKWAEASSRVAVFMTRGIPSVAAALLLSAAPALADSIDPSSYTTTLGIGDSATINKTITITEGTPTAAKVDIVFVADTTGSMFGEIASAKAGAASILSSLSGLGDVQFGVASYKDIGDVYTSRIEQGLTTNSTDVTNAINTWTASGGGNFAEANLISWTQVADDIAWRTDSRRFIVTFGDAPGHISTFSAAYPTEAAAIAALNAENIQMEIINTGTSTSGMNAACGGSTDCLSGQANRFAAATGGQVFNGFNSSGTAAAIINAVTSAFATYNQVSLQAVGNLPGVGVSTCGAISGSFDRSITRTFNCSVTFTGLTAGDHSFVINALVDGGIVATESDRIIVTGGASVPEPSTMLFLGVGLFAAGFATRLRTC